MGSSIQDTSVQIFDPDEQKNYSVNIPKSEMYLLNGDYYFMSRLLYNLIFLFYKLNFLIFHYLFKNK